MICTRSKLVPQGYKDYKKKKKKWAKSLVFGPLLDVFSSWQDGGKTFLPSEVTTSVGEVVQPDSIVAE